MCFSQPKTVGAVMAAPPPAPPANAPQAPVLNAATSSALNGMTSNSSTTRGADSLQIGLNKAGSAGNGLAI